VPAAIRGGLGYARELEVLEDSLLTVRSSNHIFGPQGHGGGLAQRHRGSCSIRAERSRGAERDRDSVISRLRCDPLRAQRAAPASPPAERAPEAVRDDVRTATSASNSRQHLRQPKD